MYGQGRPVVGKSLRANLGERFAAARIGGHAPPLIRALTPEEHFEIVQGVSACGAGIVRDRARMSFAGARSS
jgi:hypothetical protein